MIEHKIELGDLSNAARCLICLPGRGGDGTSLALQYKEFLTDDWLVVGITPQGRAWYPAPNGPKDQAAALAGLPKSVQIVDELASEISVKYDIEPNKIALLGFSAGAVVSVAAGASGRYGAIICHSGAILDPDAFPSCQNASPVFLLTHGKHDNVFTWEDRYSPMLSALKDKRYNVKTVERVGGHTITPEDSAAAKRVLESL